MNSKLQAQPAIFTVTNSAANIIQGLPNSAIAQGSIFVVYGTGLGPATFSLAPAAFQSTTLSGTSVAVTVGGTTVNALMYYTSATQVAALLPSNTPAGTGTITVTYNSQAGPPSPITVAGSSLGIFTVASTGDGAGIVTYPDYSLVSPVKAANCGGPNTTCGAANPGDTLILWATGLGPINGDDASGAGLGVNMPNIPLKLWLGGVQASVGYQGRSGCCVGEDQIVFTVPNNVPTGCAVPLVVEIGNQISNNVLIPVATSSRTCPLIRSDLASAGAEAIEQLIGTGAARSGTIELAHVAEGGGTFEDGARLRFYDVTSFAPGTPLFFVSWLDTQPDGTCLVYTNSNALLSSPLIGGSPLDAGSSFALIGPNGNVTLAPDAGEPAAFNSTGAFLVPGTYTISGTGGADVGSFTGSITIPESSTLTSPQINSTATRSNGLPVSWTPGAGRLQIKVNSCVDNKCNIGAAATCNVPASAGSFTVPSYILEALPPSSFAGVVLSSLSTASFTASGLDVGILSTFSNVGGFSYAGGTGSITLQ
jgi:uncharacterized protein (TIGR03437 family)